MEASCFLGCSRDLTKYKAGRRGRAAQLSSFQESWDERERRRGKDHTKAVEEQRREERKAKRNGNVQDGQPWNVSEGTRNRGKLSKERNSLDLPVFLEIGIWGPISTSSPLGIGYSPPPRVWQSSPCPLPCLDRSWNAGEPPPPMPSWGGVLLSLPGLHPLLAPRELILIVQGIVRYLRR